MTLQDVAKFSISTLNQILAFQKDGFTNFSLKNGREKNPNSGEMEECLVLDMTKKDKAKTVNLFYG